MTTDELINKIDDLCKKQMDLNERIFKLTRAFIIMDEALERFADSKNYDGDSAFEISVPIKDEPGFSQPMNGYVYARYVKELVKVLMK